MFETGMSALVLKICSEYAKSLGLNFPPCTQQEINAICEWVDKHTIKDMTISQDGYNVTFTFKTENDTTKEFTFTIPKKVDIDELEKVLKGSDSIVIGRNEDNTALVVRLDKSQEMKIITLTETSGMFDSETYNFIMNYPEKVIIKYKYPVDDVSGYYNVEVCTLDLEDITVYGTSFDVNTLQYRSADYRVVCGSAGDWSVSKITPVKTSTFLHRITISVSLDDNTGNIAILLPTTDNSTYPSSKILSILNKFSDFKIPCTYS